MNCISPRIHVAELADIAQNICSQWEDIEIKEDAYLTELFKELSGLTSEISKSLHHRKNMNSLKEFNLRRDHCLRMLRKLQRAFSFSTDETIKAHIEPVNVVLEKSIPEILHSNFQAKTALISAFLDALDEPAMASHLSALPGMMLAVSELCEAQKVFEDTRLEYFLLAYTDKTISASKQKDGLLEIINERLVVYLNGKLCTNPSAYGDFATVVSNIIEVGNDYVRGRRKKRS